MATLQERVARKFNKVPGVTSEDVAGWLTDAHEESELVEGDERHTDTALVYLAYALGCKDIAADAARFFSFSDKDESVDKTNIFDNYMRLSSDAYRSYRKHKNGGGGTYVQNRADLR